MARPLHRKAARGDPNMSIQLLAVVPALIVVVTMLFVALDEWSHTR